MKTKRVKKLMVPGGNRFEFYAKIAAMFLGLEGKQVIITIEEAQKEAQEMVII